MTTAQMQPFTLYAIAGLEFSGPRN